MKKAANRKPLKDFIAKLRHAGDFVSREPKTFASDRQKMMTIGTYIKMRLSHFLTWITPSERPKISAKMGKEIVKVTIMAKHKGDIYVKARGYKTKVDGSLFYNFYYQPTC